MTVRVDARNHGVALQAAQKSAHLPDADKTGIRFVK